MSPPAGTSVEETPDAMAYEFEVYVDRLIVRGVCSNAPLEAVVQWMNATSSREWFPATGVLFGAEIIGYAGRPPEKPWDKGQETIRDKPTPWPIPCPEPGKAATHWHYIVRSGAAPIDAPSPETTSHAQRDLPAGPGSAIEEDRA